MTAYRTFKITAPHMTGSDVTNWQNDIRAEFLRMGIRCPIVVDGDYGIATRGYTASLCRALGMIAHEVMEDGVTPELRIRIRNRTLTALERRRMDERDWYRAALRDRYASADIKGVHRPVTKVLEDSWDYHPPVHDGIDVICQPDAVLFAMVRSKVIDTRASGWWGKGAPANAALKSKGDGIIQLEILESVGPFVKGYHIAYGHAEKAVVNVGDIVDAGDKIGRAGFANAWHIHLMYNNGTVGARGIGNVDPRKILDYSLAHG